MHICHKCKKEIEVEGKVGREELCPHCGAYLHCCLNCRFYDEYAHNKCREPKTEWVSDRENGNFCSYFKFAESSKESGGDERSKKAKDELKRLFGKSDGDGDGA